MAASLALVREIASDLLEQHRIAYDEVPMLDEETSETRMRRPSRLKARRRRRPCKRRE